ncbi:MULTISPECIES: hypothetical protein [unclassified Flavobacterium]|uniref:hypothetical protein n=1 Tax=unclassified Flavobacterium TaxID=196869 RepID=UPI0009623C6E|nr:MULTISPECIES: hypothetical protein [unclassified Flavobacterium]MBN9284963.1 hypothetical protein [Flavobacterium sp.]OJV72270.1 MAG: hypothetical protein BGO42_03545 [Flavobacterium sp. 40-81]
MKITTLLPLEKLEELFDFPLFATKETYSLYLDTAYFVIHKFKSIYINKSGDFSLFISIQKRKYLFWTTSRITYTYKTVNSTVWNEMNSVPPESIIRFLNQYWPKLIRELAHRDTLTPEIISYWRTIISRNITVEKIVHYCSLPVVFNTSGPFTQNCKKTITGSDLSFQFDCFRTDNGSKSTITITELHNNPKRYSFLFVYETTQLQDKTISLQLQHHNGIESESRAIDFFETDYLKKALELWQAMEICITAKNDLYLQKAATQHGNTIPISKPVLKNNYVSIQGNKLRLIDPGQAQRYLENIMNADYSGKLYELTDSLQFPIRKDSVVPDVFILAEKNVHLSYLNFKEILSDYQDELNILGFIFLKDLNVASYILSDDFCYTKPLIVLGNLNTKNILLDSQTHYIQGNLNCEFFIGLGYKGSFYVNGKLAAKCLLSDEMTVYTSDLYVAALIGNGMIKFSKIVVEENNKVLLKYYSFPDTHYLKNILHATLFNAPIALKNVPKIISRIKNGLSLLHPDYNPNYSGFPVTITKRFDVIFNFLKQSGENSHTIAADGQLVLCRYLIKNYNGRTYQVVGQHHTANNYFVGIIRNLLTNSFNIIINYYEPDNKTLKLNHIIPIIENTILAKTGKHAFDSAEKALLEPVPIAFYQSNYHDFGAVGPYTINDIMTLLIDELKSEKYAIDRENAEFKVTIYNKRWAIAASISGLVIFENKELDEMRYSSLPLKMYLYNIDDEKLKLLWLATLYNDYAKILREDWKSLEELSGKLK